MRYIFIALAFVFAGELEVDGDLKVSGSIDAQNNPIQNVGIPQELTDAINGNALQDALRDDGPFEYLSYKVRIFTDTFQAMEWILLTGNIEYTAWSNDFTSELNNRALDGYEIHKMINLPMVANGGLAGQDWETVSLFILKRRIPE